MEVVEEVLEVWDWASLIQWHPKSDKEGQVVIDKETGQFVMEMTNAIQKEPMTGKVEKIVQKANKLKKRKGSWLQNRQLKTGFSISWCADASLLSGHASHVLKRSEFHSMR